MGNRTLPDAITPAIKDVLGTMCFQVIGIAQAFREAGHKIGRRAKDEQAFVLFWMPGLALKHGDQWRKAGEAELNALVKTGRGK